jgi:trimeric autotransporter adhesin
MSVSGGTLPTGTETLTAGKATGYFFAPTAGSGTLTLTATQGASHDTYIAGVKAATAAGTTYTALKDEVSLTIASDATAAAEEALAAASDAFDAALTAAEAAEMAQSIAQEALDSVASLRKRMNKRFNAIEKLIKRLL